MNTLFRNSLKLAATALLLIAVQAAVANAQSARLQLSQLDSLANKASETVDVNLDERMMQTTAKFFSSKDPDDAEIRELIKDVKGVYVKSFTFEKEGQYSQAEVESVMTQLRGSAWNKIVGITSKQEGENVEVYLLSVGDQIGGLVVLSVEPKELTVVNIVGPVNLEKLSKLEGQFGVPYFNLPPAKPKSEYDRRHP
jgi:Domain of unknown function (DUF4252)